MSNSDKFFDKLDIFAITCYTLVANVKKIVEHLYDGNLEKDGFDERAKRWECVDIEVSCDFRSARVRFFDFFVDGLPLKIFKTGNIGRICKADGRA